MLVEQSIWREATGWCAATPSWGSTPAQLVLLFGAPRSACAVMALQQLREHYPGTEIVGCSTAGEICDVEVLDDALVATAVRFEHTRVRTARVQVDSASDSHRAGAELAQALQGAGLRHVLVFSDGLNVNGTQLAAGLREALGEGVSVTGGLAGDGDRFKHTQTYGGCEPGGATAGAPVVASHQIVAVGLYGDRLRVGHGSLGGWDSFGPLRCVTRAQGNVLFELDGQPALTLYKHYLGEHAAALPSSALLFPLALHTEGRNDSLVRTVLAVDEVAGSMTFAGDIPQGAHVRLMKANFDRLIDGAAGAAQAGLEALDRFTPELAVLISCVGRKLVLKQRVEEEVESVRHVLGPHAALTGFYSYGEICPSGPVGPCELHNQTMTITTFAEAAS